MKKGEECEYTLLICAVHCQTLENHFKALLTQNLLWMQTISDYVNVSHHNTDIFGHFGIPMVTFWQQLNSTTFSQRKWNNTNLDAVICNMAARGHYRTSCKCEGTPFYSCEVTIEKLPKNGFILRKIEKVFKWIQFLNACTYHHSRRAHCKSAIYNVRHSSHLKPFPPATIVPCLKCTTQMSLQTAHIQTLKDGC